MLDSDIASIAFDHFAVRFAEANGIVRTGLAAEFTANAVTVIKNNKLRFRIPEQAVLRTGRNTGCIFTVQAGCGQILKFKAAVAVLDLTDCNITQARFTGCNICVMLINAGNFTCAACTAFIGIKRKNVFHFIIPPGTF